MVLATSHGVTGGSPPSTCRSSATGLPAPNRGVRSKRNAQSVKRDRTMRTGAVVTLSL
jgi:hypothetical protein